MGALMIGVLLKDGRTYTVDHLELWTCTTPPGDPGLLIILKEANACWELRRPQLDPDTRRCRVLYVARLLGVPVVDIPA
jgi:hypothetical protein